MNSIGGHLLIGVDDDQNILGIDGDQKDFSEDKFERGFMDVLQAALEPFDPSIVNTSFHEIDGKVLFLVEVRKSKVVPVYVNMPIIHPDPQIFLRRGAASIALSPKEAVEFITRSKRAKV
jgi:predicted HTH transcriptional regulator